MNEPVAEIQAFMRDVAVRRGDAEGLAGMYIDALKRVWPSHSFKYDVTDRPGTPVDQPRERQMLRIQVFEQSETA